MSKPEPHLTLNQRVALMVLRNCTFWACFACFSLGVLAMVLAHFVDLVIRGELKPGPDIHWSYRLGSFMASFFITWVCFVGAIIPRRMLMKRIIWWGPDLVPPAGPTWAITDPDDVDEWGRDWVPEEADTDGNEGDQD